MRDSSVIHLPNTELPMRTPTYIVKHRNGIYYFRYVIPILQAHLFPNNRREIRRTLNTRIRSEALKRARIYWVNMNSKIISDKYAWEEQSDEHSDKVIRGNELISELEKYDSVADRYNYEEYLAHLSEYDNHCIRVAGMHKASKATALSSPTENHTASAPPTTNNFPAHPLDELFEKHLQDKGDIEDKTLNGYRRHFNLFIKITSISTTTDLDKDVIRKYKDTVPKLPPKITQNKELSNKTIAQILDMTHDRLLTVKTINENFRTIKAFVEWLAVQDYIEKNLSSLLTNIKSNQLKKSNAHTAAFTKNDLDKLFSTEEYQTEGFRKYSFRYWLPLLYLFTGARPNEICQLRVDDIYFSDGILIIDINNDNHEIRKKVKSLSSVRQIPVHKTLLSLGFEDYVNTVKGKNETQLFPSLRPNKDGFYTKKISVFFNSNYKSHNGGYLNYCGIDKNSSKGRKVLYSFRHSFINQWKQQQLNNLMLKQVAGHSTGEDLTNDLYGKDFDIKTIHEELNKVDFKISKLPMKWLARLYT